MNREQWKIKREHHPEVEPLTKGIRGPNDLRQAITERRKKKPVPVNSAESPIGHDEESCCDWALPPDNNLGPRNPDS